MAPAPCAIRSCPARAAERGRVAPRARRRRSHDPAAVERRHGRDELERVGVHRRAPARRSASGSRRPVLRPAARSASSATLASASSIRLTICRTASSFARISMATMPCPGAGTQALAGSVIEMRDANPRRRSPAAASTSASCSPASSFLSRVSRLPRMGANRAPLNTPESCAMRRTLPVPMFGRCVRVPRPDPSSVSALCPVPSALTGSTTASSGSSRGSTAAIARPSGSSAGMSLLLCTARSMSFLSSASSISLTKRRFPPASDSGRSAIASPDVLMTTMRQGGPPRSSDGRRDRVGLPQRELAASRAEPELAGRGRHVSADRASARAGTAARGRPRAPCVRRPMRCPGRPARAANRQARTRARSRPRTARPSPGRRAP